MIGGDMTGVSIDGLAAWPVPLLARIPLLGPGLFSHDPVVYGTLLLVPVAWWLVHRSRAGLRLAADDDDGAPPVIELRTDADARCPARWMASRRPLNAACRSSSL